MGQVQNGESTYKMKPVFFNREIHEDIKWIMEHVPTADIFIKLITHINKEIEDFFVGRRNGGDILFVNETIFNLWNDFFNNNYDLYSGVNYGAAYGITNWLS